MGEMWMNGNSQYIPSFEAFEEGISLLFPITERVL
jgi:hypothetical protein